MEHFCVGIVFFFFLVLKLNSIYPQDRSLTCGPFLKFYVTSAELRIFF